MALRSLETGSISVGRLLWVMVASAGSVVATTCDASHHGTTCHSQIENQEAGESAAAQVEMLQTKQLKPILGKSNVNASGVEQLSGETDVALLTQETLETKSESDLVSKDHNDNVCILCGKPLAERVDREYSEFRTDCGQLSSATGPNASTIAMPVSKLTQISDTGLAKNGFCQLNFAKSCVDAIANKDYLYWAKSINLKAPGSIENAPWDGRYCRMNGFLESSLVALQHDFHAAQAKADELCRTKYAKYNIHNITFMDMMNAARYDDKTAPTLAEAELLAAWNCAMGDLGCDMALCAYSFCDKGAETGLYDECKGWHPVRGMPFAF